MTRARCTLCNDDSIEPAPAAILNHLRLFHPDEYEAGPARWPDGGLVVIEDARLAEPDTKPWLDAWGIDGDSPQ